MKVFRLLIYDGTAEWITQTLAQNAIAEGVYRVGGEASVSSITLGSVPDAVQLSLKEKPKYTYADAKQILDEFELAVVADAFSAAGDPDDVEDIEEEAERARKTIIDMLKEVTSGRS